MAREFESIDQYPYTKPFFFEGGKTGILLVHGFTGSPGTMQVIGEALSRDGYTVSGILLPGHGTHITDMESATWQDWLRAARDGANELRQKCDKIIICGLSMGGVLTLILAGELPVDGAVTIAAAMELTDKLSKFAWLFKYFVRYRGEGKRDPDENPYKIGYNVTPIRKVPDLIKLQKIALRRLPEIKCPLLIFRAMQDKTVTKEAADMIYNGAVNARSREIVDLPTSEHLCTVDNEADIIIERTREFIKEAMKQEVFI